MGANVIDFGMRTNGLPGRAVPRRRTQPLPQRQVTRDEVLDSAARVLVRRGYQGLLFGGIARELGVATRSVLAVCSDKPELVRACYKRSASAFEEALMAAETATGAAVQKLDLFLTTMLALRRERGGLLSLALADGPSTADIRWCRAKDRVIRTRLERLLRSGQRDRSIRARDAAAATQLILALLCSCEPPLAPDSAVADLDDLKQLIFGGLAAR